MMTSLTSSVSLIPSSIKALKNGVPMTDLPSTYASFTNSPPFMYIIQYRFQWNQYLEGHFVTHYWHPIYITNHGFFFLNINNFRFKNPFTPSFTRTITTDFLTLFTSISMNSTYLTPNINSTQHSFMCSCQLQLCSVLPPESWWSSNCSAISSLT